MSDEFLDGPFPHFLQQLFVAHDLQLVHKPLNVFDQDVVACNEHFFLLLLILIALTKM